MRESWANRSSGPSLCLCYSTFQEGSFFFRQAGYMSPFIILLGSMPMYTTGKVQRNIMVLEF